MSKGWNKIIIVVLLSLGCSSLLFSRDKSGQDFRIKDNSTTYSTNTDSIVDYPVKWPVYIAGQETEKFRTIFDNFGHFGYGFAYFSGIIQFSPTFSVDYSFESPPQSTIEYLYGGGIWVGAIVGNDTLVSTSVDGWQIGYDEFAGDVFIPNIEKIDFPSDYSLRCEFNDTSTKNILNDIISGKPYTPLNIKITDKSYVWRNYPLDNAVIYDYTITNIGNQQLDQAYIGFYFDADVGSDYGQQGSGYYLDDIVGSIRDSGIGYILDNDGDPVSGAFNQFSPTKGFAFELLASSFIPEDTTFNWWISGQGDFDFGPRLKGTPDDPFRDFGTGGIGTAEGDANKYYMMSHKEWDYDIALIKKIDSIDTTWISPNTVQPDLFVQGTDTRFLYSIGPFDLAPGQSERIIFSTFTADSIIVDTDNILNLPDSPFTYIDNLNLENLMSVGSAIRSVVDSIVNPMLQPTGLEIYDYNKIKFDPFAFDGVTGYNVYATPVNAATFPFLGVIPPWFRPESPIYIGSDIDEIPLNAINGLTAVQVSYNSALGESELSEPAYINMPNPVKPIVSDVTITSTEDSALITWEIPDTAEVPIYFKIYKFAPEENSSQYYTQPYYLEGGGDALTTDSILVDSTWWFYQATIREPTAIVLGSERQYVATNVQDSTLYLIVSVDQYGFESPASYTRTYVGKEQTKDLLIIINSEIASISTSDSTIKNFYTRILGSSDLKYDFYSILDSMSADACTSDECPTWQQMSQYKYVLVDESEYNPIYWLDAIPNYLASSGNFINFGSLSNLSQVTYGSQSDWFTTPNKVKDYFGVDSIFSYGHLYNYPNSYEEANFGFNIAESANDSFPSLECDTSKYPLDYLWNLFLPFPSNEPLQVSGLVPADSTEITHRYKSLYPTTSLLQDLPVGIKHVWHNGNISADVYSYGFHLYYMKENDSRNLLSTILGVEIKSCCIGMRGNIDKDANNIIDIVDLVYLVDYMFTAGPAPICIEQANIDGDLGEQVDISDLVALVYYMYGGGPAPAMCP